MSRYNLVDFSSNEVLDVHLELVGLDTTIKNRETLRNMGKELRLLFGRDFVRHIELQCYIMMAKNFCRLV